MEIAFFFCVHHKIFPFLNLLKFYLWTFSDENEKWNFIQKFLHKHDFAVMFLCNELKCRRKSLIIAEAISEFVIDE